MDLFLHGMDFFRHGIPFDRASMPFDRAGMPCETETTAATPWLAGAFTRKCQDAKAG